MKHSILYEQVQIGKLKLKNRFAMAPMGPLGLADDEGSFNQQGIDFYVERAKGGTGLIITGVTFVENEIEMHTMPNCPCPTHNPIHFIRNAKFMAERIHAYDSKIFLQLSGGFGRVSIPKKHGEFYPVAPSPIQHRWTDKTCRELTVDEIKTIVSSFGKSASIAKHAGFDGVEIHAVHEGYLIDQFAISMFNQRTDEYGGSLENRLRFAREIVEEIKRACGPDFPVALRYSPKSFIKDWRVGALPGEEFVEMGRDIPEGIEAAKLLVSYGYDALDVDVGSYDAWWWSHPPIYQEKGLYIEYAKIVKEAVDVPVICAGRMDNPQLAEFAVRSGACDIVSLGRPLLADPDYANKLRAGKAESIRPCLSCQEGCMGRIQVYSSLNCAVNPVCGHESTSTLIPAQTPKKVLIIGGGPAGCEAARVLRLRGHIPVVCEASARLGGNLIPSGVPKFKEDDTALADWYAYTLKELDIEVRLENRMDANSILKEDFDALILACGSTPKVMSLGDGRKVFTASDALLGRCEVGDDVVIVGGGLVGCETALWLATEHGKNVTIIEILDEILKINGPLCHANSAMLKNLIPFHNIAVKTLATASRTTEGGIIAVCDGREEEIPADTILLSIGYAPNDSLYKALWDRVGSIYRIGDARNVANVMYAVWEAFEVATHIE